MAMANKFRGWLVLICGNKSELAVGYTTIYGVDMAGRLRGDQGRVQDPRLRARPHPQRRGGTST